MTKTTKSAPFYQIGFLNKEATKIKIAKGIAFDSSKSEILKRVRKESADNKKLQKKLNKGRVVVIEHLVHPIPSARVSTAGLVLNPRKS